MAIENLGFEKLIKIYDRPTAAFYCDPPYYGAEKYYGVPFSDDDHQRLRDTLGNIKGKFILSYNSHDYIKELYKDYHIEEISRSNNLAAKYEKGATYGELIIRNY